MPLKEYQATSYSDLQCLLEKITEIDDAEIFIFFSCTLERHGDPKTKACFESEDCLMEYTEFIRGSKRSLHLIFFRMQLEYYYEANSEISRDAILRVADVPTLLKWPGYQRLTGRQCSNIPLLSMVFEKECPKKFPVFTPCYYFGKAEDKPQAAGDITDGSAQAVGTEAGQSHSSNAAAKDGSKTQNVNATSGDTSGTKMSVEPGLSSEPISEKP